jgi:hypothetical protein
MEFGPLELQACGENNFTMKALGLLAFRPDLRARFIRSHLDPTFDASSRSSVLFFSRIGEGFFREAIEREATAGQRGEFEERLNVALGLPAGFRWRRNADGRITQPAKWQNVHVDQMLDANGRSGDMHLRDRLSYLQDCINTEPDVVLQWGSHLALVEIKVLSVEGTQQLDRQRELGRLLSDVLGWACHFAFIGPEHGGRPSTSDCTFISWSEIAELFDDVPEIAGYIRGFAFYYRGSWQSMVSRYVEQPSVTAYDLFMSEPVSATPAEPPTASLSTPVVRPVTQAGANPWHFSHLGRDYFQRVLLECRSSGHIPIRTVWTGRTGVPYAERAAGRAINANWMIETESGKRRTNRTRTSYDPGRMWRWDFDEIARHFDLRHP